MTATGVADRCWHHADLVGRFAWAIGGFMTDAHLSDHMGLSRAEDRDDVQDTVVREHE